MKTCSKCLLSKGAECFRPKWPSVCIPCANSYNRKYIEKHIDRNREEINAKDRERMAIKRGKRTQVQIDEQRKKSNLYESGRKPQRAAACAKRYAAKMKAIPLWANDFFMEEAYQLAALRTKIFGFKWHVDHMVPLQGKIVCGLHSHDNLQVIPARANETKGNRFWPNMP